MPDIFHRPSRRRKAGLWAAGAAALALAACQSVPYTGRSQFLLVSADQERSIGEQAYKETLQKAKLSTDTVKAAMIRRVGHRLSRVADRPDFRWEFNLIEDDKTINAWCLPGGKVAFYTGIMPVAAGEDGVAVVMSHEIAHAIARHGAERMSQGMLAQGLGQALSVAVAKQPAQTRQIYEQAYGLGVGLGILLPYSRKQESEADHIGLILMAKAGYDPNHALSFWQRMEKATGGKDENNPLTKYLRTHPTGRDRQDQIRGWIPEAMRYFRRPGAAGPGQPAPGAGTEGRPGP